MCFEFTANTMKPYCLFITALLLANVSLTLAQSGSDIKPPAPVGPVPSPAQLDWHRMELNAFVHFTTNTFTNKEWGFGDESPRVFNPTAFDADQWVAVLQEAGFQGVILTCKHHDGFVLWPSAYTDHSVAQSPWRDGQGDVVKAVSEACRRRGLKFGVYLSPWDRHRADYGQPSYITYYRNQLKELFTQYGPMFEMWFDGANGGDGYYGGANETRQIDGQTYYDWPTTINMIRKLQPEPEVLFFSDAGPGVRWVGNEKGIAGETNWNTITSDTLYAGLGGINDLLATGSPDGTSWIPAEVDVSIRPGWFYHPEEDSLVKSPEELFDIYLTSVGRGSTLLLNVPPDRRGLVHENDVAALRGWRKLLDEAFAENIAAGATATADQQRGEGYAAQQVVDEDFDTYWATSDVTTTGSLVIDWGKPARIQYVTLQEYIPLGQRISAFSVEVWRDSQWQSVAEATTVGYKRILKIDPVETSKIRVNIQEAKACPTLATVGVY